MVCSADANVASYHNVGTQEKARIRLKNHKTKYRFAHPGKGLRGAPVNLTLVWHVMPRVGKCVLCFNHAFPFLVRLAVPCYCHFTLWELRRSGRVTLCVWESSSW